MTQQILSSRRKVLKTISAGSAVSIIGVGNAAAQRVSCPECPDGTGLLAKYEFDEESGEFVFDEGACEDILIDVSYVNKKGEENEPIEVSFTSKIFAGDVTVKAGPDCVKASESDEVTYTVDEKKDNDGFEGTISIDPSGPAISHFNLCAAVCAQADFIVGEPTDPAEYNTGDELIGVNWTSTDPNASVPSKYPINNEGKYDYLMDVTDVAFDDKKATVTFDVSVDNGPITLSLVSYSATCPPGYDMDTAYIQDKVDVDKMTFEVGEDGVTFTVDIPGLEYLDELCDI